ncbi:hypothetical protein ANN_09752 [Periplaneta americana]|uniref:DUF4817 domain-containing protein n=1 Tax=Periplaneta americana TaxID=6978 RepID=A0ABQ8TM59_PERAM|nr:hypothetical protein ANN_09752 [Periplaneta americana]
MQHKMVFTIKQRVFIVECYAKHNSWKRCAELLAQEFQTGRVLANPSAKAAMQNLVAKWRETGSVVNKNRNYPKRVRTPENIARVQESLEQSPTKSQRRLSVQVRIKRT